MKVLVYYLFQTCAVISIISAIVNWDNSSAPWFFAVAVFGFEAARLGAKRTL